MYDKYMTPQIFFNSRLMKVLLKKERKDLLTSRGLFGTKPSMNSAGSWSLCLRLATNFPVLTLIGFFSHSFLCLWLIMKNSMSVHILSSYANIFLDVLWP